MKPEDFEGERGRQIVDKYLGVMKEFEGGFDA
jgi:hypothetical protein